MCCLHLQASLRSQPHTVNVHAILHRTACNGSRQPGNLSRSETYLCEDGSEVAGDQAAVGDPHCCPCDLFPLISLHQPLQLGMSLRFGRELLSQVRAVGAVYKRNVMSENCSWTLWSHLFSVLKPSAALPNTSMDLPCLHDAGLQPAVPRKSHY